MKLDETDYKILEILQSDGRISYSDLAEKVSLSRTAVRERVNYMMKTGIIRGFTAIIDAKAYEKFASVYMNIETEPSKLDHVAHELMKLEDVAIVSQHTGVTGLHVHAYIDSPDKVSKYLEDNIYKIDGVKAIHSELLIHQYKTTAYLARYSE